MTSEVIGKGLGLFKQNVPNVSPMAVLWNPDDVVYQGQSQGTPPANLPSRRCAELAPTDEFKKIFLRTVTHLREGDHGPRPHQLIDRCPSQKQKPNSDRDIKVGDEMGWPVFGLPPWKKLSAA